MFTRRTIDFYAAGNLGVSSPLRFAVRRFLEFCRTVPELVFALIFVLAFGLGPIAGVLAIIVHTTGALGKLFYEVLENVDQKPVEGLIASGASWTKTMRFAGPPQVLSNFVSYALLRFEINVHGASVMGFVGAGGIGQYLIEAIRKFCYPDVSAILILIIVTVALIDLVTERARYARTFDRQGWSGYLFALAAVALLVYGLWHLGFSFSKFLLGLSSLGNFVVLMFPPNWGDNENLALHPAPLHSAADRGGRRQCPRAERGCGRRPEAIAPHPHAHRLRLCSLANVVHGAQARGFGIRAWSQALAPRQLRERRWTASAASGCPPPASAPTRSPAGSRSASPSRGR